MIGTEIFSGSSVEDMDRFVPKKFTKRMIFSKLASVFDLPGKFTPVEVGMKRDLRSSAKLTATWDYPVRDELRGMGSKLLDAREVERSKNARHSC